MNQLTPTGICASIEPPAEPTAASRQQALIAFVCDQYVPSTGQDPSDLYSSLTQLSLQTGFAALFGNLRRTRSQCDALGALTLPLTEPSTPQHMVVWLLNNSGLTGDQLSRILGVSRRAVYTWVDGRRVNGANLERLATVYQCIKEIPATRADERRHLLFTPRGRQRTLFDDLAAKARKPAPPRNTVSVAERLGAAD